VTQKKHPHKPLTHATPQDHATPQEDPPQFAHEAKFDKEGFRLRGTQMSRIDGFSDVVFGFALTLLVVSLEVPKTYQELTVTLSGFAAFALCFFLLLSIWHHHFTFFRRYDLDDPGTIALNTILLFLVLFLVYPMKFLFSLVSINFLGYGDEVRPQVWDSNPQIANLQVERVLMLYGLGFFFVYFVFVLLTYHAWRKRDELHLNELEKLLTRKSLTDNIAICLIGLLCVLLAHITRDLAPGTAGLIFCLIPFQHLAVRIYFKRKRKRKAL
jgi:hypothetical protein